MRKQKILTPDTEGAQAFSLESENEAIAQPVVAGLRNPLRPKKI